MHDPRGAILIDGSYLEKLKQNLNSQRLDLVKLSDFCCEPYERLRTYYYDSLPWIAQDKPSVEDIDRRAKKQRYFQTLTNLPRFEVRLGRLEKRKIECVSCSHIEERFDQKLVDVLLSVDMVRLAWSGQVGTITVIGGDSDFAPAVRAAKDAGTIVKLLYAKEKNTWVHNELLNACDEKIRLTSTFLENFKLR